MPNTTTVTLGGHEYLLRASNYASQVYSETFYGRTKGEYNGVLDHDAAQMLNDCVSTDDEGNITVTFITPALNGIIWALAYAAGSVQTTYDAWLMSTRDEVWTVYEQSDACVEIIDLMMDTFFRQRPEQGGEEPEQG